MSDYNKQIDQIFSKWDNDHSPGCAVATIKDGKVIHQAGYGMANLEYHVPITGQTIFHIASISKMFTALAVTMLAHEGKCSLSDRVQQYIPELHEFEHPITLQHLIYHTSGIRDQWDLLTSAEWRIEDVITQRDILELLYRQKELNFTPGDEYLYSNSGYTLLAEIVKRVSGKSLREFCDERLFTPLGMLNTHFHDDCSEIVPNRANSYDPYKDGFKNSLLSFSNVGATSLFTTIEDLVKWELELENPLVLSPELIDENNTECTLNNGQKSGYAYGWMVDSYRGLQQIGHSGADAGFRSHFARFPEQGFAVIVLANHGRISPSTLCEKITDVVLADQLEPMAEKQVVNKVEVSEEILKSLAGVYASEKLGNTYQITVKEGHLSVDLGSGLQLEAASEVDYFPTQFPQIKLHFETEANLTRMFLYTGEPNPEIYEKLPDFQPASESLMEYCGGYDCPELDTTWYLTLSNEKLRINRKKYYDIALFPVNKDKFEVRTESHYNISFERNENDQITGFRMNSGRVRNLKFNKQLQ